MITSPIDGRIVFIVPWGDLSYIGTTDSYCSAVPDTVYANGEDVVYLLRSANALFPDARLTPADVVATWAGLRPLLAPENPQDPRSVSREHRILESANGLVSIVGGKLTTYRVMAAETVDRVAKRLRDIDGRPMPPSAATDREPLPGGEIRDLEVLIGEATREGFSQATAEHLVQAYGSETPAVVRLAQSSPEMSNPIAENHPAIVAELVHAIRREMAVTLCDLLIRRIHLFYETSNQAWDQAPFVADVAAKELGWGEQRKEAELAAYQSEIERSMAFRSELAGMYPI